MRDNGPTVQDVREFIEHALRLLDDRRFDDWLALFADDGYYRVMQRDNYERGDNLVLMGEDLRRLGPRIVAGRLLDPRQSVHLLSGLECGNDDGLLHASASFALWRDGIPSFAGRYYLELRWDGARTRISRWTAVLDNKVVTETIYLPI